MHLPWPGPGLILGPPRPLLIRIDYPLALNDFC